MRRMFFLFIFLVTSARGHIHSEGDSCVDEYSNTVGTCTVIYRCESAKNDFHQSRILPTFCANNVSGDRIVCCRDGWRATDDRSIWGNAAGDINDRRRVSERKCDEYSRSVVKKVSYIPLIPDAKEVTVFEPNCKYSGDPLIIGAGGEDAELEEFPHMAAIGWADFNGGYKFSCGGTLISPRFVVTAAHCYRDSYAKIPEPVIVRLGKHNIDSNEDDGADPVDVLIRRIQQHPDYRSPKVYNDIALLELVADVELRPAIRPACLWTKNDLGGHKKVIATGWGVVNPRTRQTAKKLQKIPLPILDVGFCNQTLKMYHNRNWLSGFIDSQMCVGDLSGQKDTCEGDSGGPIQVASRENACIFHIVGVTSFGKNCANINKPAVYTRISSYVDWIESVVWPGQ